MNWRLRPSHTTCSLDHCYVFVILSKTFRFDRLNLSPWRSGLSFEIKCAVSPSRKSRYRQCWAPMSILRPHNFFSQMSTKYRVVDFVSIISVFVWGCMGGAEDGRDKLECCLSKRTSHVYLPLHSVTPFIHSHSLTALRGWIHGQMYSSVSVVMFQRAFFYDSSPHPVRYPGAVNKR